MALATAVGAASLCAHTNADDRRQEDSFRTQETLLTEILSELYPHDELMAKFSLNNHENDGRIHIDVYDSRLESREWDGNCVAFTRTKKIVCDISLVDDLIDDLSLAGSMFNKDWYRKKILKWILAHEIGHIELKHGVSHYREQRTGFAVFDSKQHELELAADRFAVELVGNLDVAETGDYQAVMDIANALIRRSVCPRTFPQPCPCDGYDDWTVCSKGGVGVGLVFSYSEPIEVTVRGTHPEYIARFLRILFVAGEGTDENSINYLAKQVIEQVLVEKSTGIWERLSSIFGG